LRLIDLLTLTIQRKVCIHKAFSSAEGANRMKSLLAVLSPNLKDQRS